MNWFVLYYSHSRSLPAQAQIAMLMALSWAEPQVGAELHIKDMEGKQARYARCSEDLLAGLELAAAAGWLAPIVVDEDGTVRTALTVPEGVVG